MLGFLNVNKPSGITSHKVISILRKITGIKQIGHAGTLDPLASGVLPIAIGKAAKLIDYLPSDKAYTVVLRLGMTSDTFDIQGQIKKTNCGKISEEEIKKALSLFQGRIKQIPPAFSAVHYNGKRLYELARAGQIPDDIPSREVEIYKNNIVDFDYENQILTLDIECSKGTYIRTIVNDLGNNLKSGAVMTELKRTMAAGLNINSSVSLNESLTIDDIKNNLLNPCDILQIEKYEINDEEYSKIKNGNKFKNRTKMQNEVLIVKNGEIIAFAKGDNDFIQPKKVFI